MPNFTPHLDSNRPRAPEPTEGLTASHIVALQDSIDRVARELRLQRIARATSQSNPTISTTIVKTNVSRTTSTAVTNVTRIRTTTSTDCRCTGGDTVGEDISALDATIESLERSLDEDLNVSDEDPDDTHDVSTYPYQHNW